MYKDFKEKVRGSITSKNQVVVDDMIDSYSYDVLNERKKLFKQALEKVSKMHEEFDKIKPDMAPIYDADGKVAQAGGWSQSAIENKNKKAKAITEIENIMKDIFEFKWDGEFPSKEDSDKLDKLYKSLKEKCNQN